VDNTISGTMAVGGCEESADKRPSYSDVVNRKNATKRMKEQSRSANLLDGQSVVTNNRGAEQLHPRRTNILGASVTSTFKAAKNLFIKKAVYRLGNIDANYSQEDVTSHLESLDIRFVSCFVLPKRDFLPADNKQFRICIFAVDEHILLNTSNWVAGITIQEWIFKPKDPSQDAPRRMSSGRLEVITSAFVHGMPATVSSISSNATGQSSSDCLPSGSDMHVQNSGIIISE